MPALSQTGLTYSILAPAGEVIAEKARKTSLSHSSIPIQKKKKKQIKASTMEVWLGTCQSAVIMHVNDCS